MAKKKVTTAVVGDNGKVVSTGVKTVTVPKPAPAKTVTVAPKATQKAAPKKSSGVAAKTPIGLLGSVASQKSPIGALSTAVTGQKSGKLVKKVGESLVSSRPDQAPRNAGQWLINLLSTGDYAVGEAGYKSNGITNQATNEIGRGEIGKGLADLGKGAAAFGQGLVTGAQEGVGLRPEGRAPKTPSSVFGGDFDTSQVTDKATKAQLRKIQQGGGATGDIAGKNTGGKFAVGLGADIALDPFSWVSLGAGAAAKAGVRGAIDTGKAALDAEGAANTAKALVKGVGATAAKTAKAGAHGFGRNLVEGGDAIGNVFARAAARRAGTIAPVAAETGADAARAVATEAPEVAARQVDTPVAAATRTGEPAIVHAEREAVAPEAAAVPEPAAVDEAVPAAQTLNRPAAEIDDAGRAALREINGPLGSVPTAEKVLGDAAESVGDPVLTADHVQALQLAATSGPRAVDSTLRLLRKDGDLKAFLDGATPVEKAGRRLTVGELIERVATRSATGDASGSNPVALQSFQREQQALQRILAQAGATSRRTTPDTLEAALTSNGVTLRDMTPAELFGRLRGARSPAERSAIMQKVIEDGTGERYPDVESAIAAGIGGDLTHGQTRKLVAALGLATRSNKASDLRSALSADGAWTWQRAQETLSTPEEVMLRHGIDADELDAAKDVDMPAAQESAQRAVDDAHAAADADPVRARDGGSAQTKINDAAMTGFGSALVRIGGNGRRAGELNPGASEAFGNRVWLNGWSAAAREMSKIAGGIFGNGRVAERQAFAAERLVSAMRTAEDSMRALGVFPRIAEKTGNGALEDGGPLFVSISQLLDGLPDDVMRNAFFPEGISMVDVQKGITLFPTTFANGVRRALLDRATDPERFADTFVDTVLKQAERDVRGRGVPFVKTEQGRAALDALATHLRDSDYLDHMEEIHRLTQPLAVRAASDAADGVTMPLSARLIEIVSRQGGNVRGELAAEIARAQTAHLALTGATDGPNLASDLASSRIGQGLINGILGDEGSRIARADERVASAQQPDELLAAQRRAVEAQRTGGRGARPRRMSRAERAEQRATNARMRSRDLEDAADVIDDVADDVAREDVGERVNIETIQELRQQMGILDTAGDAIGVAMSGSHGMTERAKTLLIQGERASRVLNEQFTKSLRRSIRDWRKGLQNELHLKGAASVEVLTASARTWIAALARLDDDIAPARVEQALIDGGMSEVQAGMAKQLKDQIDRVFGTAGGGPLGRAKTTSQEMYDAMRNFSDAAILPDASLDIAHQTGIWKSWANEDIDPLDSLNKWFYGMTISQVNPGIAASFGTQFGVRTSAAAAAERGLVRINTQDEKSLLARHMDPDLYYEREDVKKLAYVQHFLQASKSFNGKGTRAIVAMYDLQLRILKSSATVWRPGHHVTNILGELGVNLMDGVSPFNGIRALRAMHSGGNLLDADWSVMNDVAKNLGDVDSKILGSDVLVHVGGRIQRIPIKKLYEQALASGVAQTHSSARDISESLAEQLNPRGFRARVERSKLNVIAQGDKGLGWFSAQRDNVTRLSHYISVLERGRYATLDEAFNAAATRVHRFHPSFDTLSAGEQKYARRIFYFYTWQRQAISLILSTAIERPGLVTIPSKAQYQWADVNGLDPESFGKVQNDDRLPSYYDDTLLGPTWSGGATPLAKSDSAATEYRILAGAGIENTYGSVDEALTAGAAGFLSVTQGNALLAALGDSGGPYKMPSTVEDHMQDAQTYWTRNKQGNLWGLSLSQPQVDTLQSLFTGADTQPGYNVAGNAGYLGSNAARSIIGQNLAPTLVTPWEVLSGQKLPSTNSQVGSTSNEITNKAAYVADQLGAPTQLAKTIPYTGPGAKNGESVYQHYFPKKSDAYGDASSNTAERTRALLNYLTGLKFTNYTSGSAQAVAAKQKSDAAAAAK